MALEGNVEKGIKIEPFQETCFYTAISRLLRTRSVLIADNTYSKYLLQLLKEIADLETFISLRLYQVETSQVYQKIDKQIGKSLIQLHIDLQNSADKSALREFGEDEKKIIFDFPLQELEKFINSKFKIFYDYFLNDYLTKKIACYQRFLKNIGKPDFEETRVSSTYLEKIQTLAQAFLAEEYRFKTSSWSPDQSLDDLLKILRQFGPLIVAGEFGKNYYEKPPVELQDSLPKKVQGWSKGASRLKNPRSNFVIIIGCVKIETASGGGLVYFIDPNDPSDPENPQKHILYKISYQNLKASVRKFELMKSYAIYL